MRVLREYDEIHMDRTALIFALGAAGGLAIGMALSRRPGPGPMGRKLGAGLRNRARTVARRLSPARLRRMAVEQDELTALEDAVLDSFLMDEVLRERGIEVGAISRGIVELSGSVWNEVELDRAVRVASGVDGVRTVVNRVAVEEVLGRRRGLSEEASGAETLLRQTARTGGMGRRRQSLATEPARPDESQHRAQRANAAADRDQWSEEGYAHTSSSGTERVSVQQTVWRETFTESELDNQDPHGKNAAVTFDRPPEELNSAARVGEGLKPGEELRQERADVPLKPHGDWKL